MNGPGSSVDVLSDILGTLHLRGSLYFTTEFSPPWGVRVPVLGNVARFHLLLRGACWIGIGENPERVRLERGDLVLIPHGAGHVLSDSAETPAVGVDEVVRRSGFKGRGTLVYGGPDRGEATRMLCGHFEFDEKLSHPLLKRLPDRIVIRHEEAGRHEWLSHVLGSILGEVREGRPGSEAILQRLTEVLFIQSIRVWAEGSGTAPGVMAALAEPGIGQCLAALHGDPGRPWTLDSLAREAGLSRTVFAQRFHRLLDITPMQYVAFWRVQQSRPLLERDELPVEEIAGRLGYASSVAFGRVFRKWVGVSPARYRRGRRG